MLVKVAIALIAVLILLSLSFLIFKPFQANPTMPPEAAPLNQNSAINKGR